MTSDSSAVKKKRKKKKRRTTKILYVRGRCLVFPSGAETDSDIEYVFSLQNEALCQELDAERKASAIAANEAMAMIARLHEEKSLLDLASRQYKRFAEEREVHHRETIFLLKELLLHRDREDHHHHHFHHHPHLKEWLLQTNDYTVLCSSSSSSSSSDGVDDDNIVRNLADSFVSAKPPNGTEEASGELGSLLFPLEAGNVALMDKEIIHAQDTKDSSVESSQTGMVPLQQQQSILLRLFKDFISLIGHLCHKRISRLCQKDREPPWSYKGNGGFPCMLEMQNLSRKK